MRERTQLEEQLGALSQLERELDDAITLVELGEAEGDADTEKEGVEALKAVLKEAQSKGQLNRDAAQLQRVRAIAARLVPATAVFRQDAPGWKWEVNVISSNEVNAWCMPGGKIAFYTGILRQLKLTDDEVAMVMGHEIAHALREHAREQASKNALTKIGAVGLSIATGGKYDGLVSTGANLLSLSYSRSDETDADLVGLDIAARAGYDPRAGITLWQKMGQTGGDEPPKFMSTHPPRSDRVKDLTKYSERVMPLYQQARARG